MEQAGEGIKKLGFGLMRLPQKDGVIDVEQVKEMVDLFMEAGFSYYDTAWAYEGSEEACREALIKRYPRESYQLATKVSAWIGCRSKEDAVKQFETSLERTGAGYFDYYLLHNLGQNRTAFYDDFDMWNWAFEMKEKGLIRHVGFSFHGGAEELDGILNAHPEAEFVQLQINYADWDDPVVQSGGVYETARKHGKPVIIMEPVKGGTLANPPQTVKDVFAAADPEASNASWAVKFAADLEGVMTVLSGMSSVDQMKDNLSYMKDFNGMSDAERAVVRHAREELAKVPMIPCTGCNYCLKVCPAGVGIPGTFSAVNIATVYDNLPFALNKQMWQVDKRGLKRAGECIGCGACEEACPQQIRIREELAKAAEILVE